MLIAWVTQNAQKGKKHAATERTHFLDTPPGCLTWPPSLHHEVQLVAGALRHPDIQTQT